MPELGFPQKWSETGIREIPLGGDPKKHRSNSGFADGQAAAGQWGRGWAQETGRMGSDLSSSRGG